MFLNNDWFSFFSECVETAAWPSVKQTTWCVSFAFVGECRAYTAWSFFWTWAVCGSGAALAPEACGPRGAAGWLPQALGPVSRLCTVQSPLPTLKAPRLAYCLWQLPPPPALVSHVLIFFSFSRKSEKSIHEPSDQPVPAAWKLGAELQERMLHSSGRPRAGSQRPGGCPPGGPSPGGRGLTTAQPQGEQRVPCGTPSMKEGDAERLGGKMRGRTRGLIRSDHRQTHRRLHPWAQFPNPFPPDPKGRSISSQLRGFEGQPSNLVLTKLN